MTDLNKASQEFWLTQAQYDTRKNAGTLVVGAIYHITDVSYENTSNKVTSISSSSTDTQYPSAKCVYDEVSQLSQDKVDKSSQATKTSAMTSEVGIDADGKLWSVAGGVSYNQWELLNDITLTEAIAKLELTQDDNGVTYNLKGLLFYYKPNSAVASSNIFFRAISNSSSYVIFNTYAANRTMSNDWYMYSFSNKNNAWHGTTTYYMGNGSVATFIPGYPIFNNIVHDYNVNKIEFFGTVNFPAGTVFKVYGVRA